MRKEINWGTRSGASLMVMWENSITNSKHWLNNSENINYKLQTPNFAMCFSRHSLEIAGGGIWCMGTLVMRADTASGIGVEILNA